MRIAEALSGFANYLDRNGYGALSRENYLRYLHNRLHVDIFMLLPFKNIFGYKGKLNFLTMDDYLKHYPQKFIWKEYVLELPVEVLEQRILRTLWENAPAGTPLRCIIRYLHEERFLSHPVITRQRPRWKQEVEKLLSKASSGPETLEEGFGSYLRYLIDEKNLTQHGLLGCYSQLKAALDWLCQHRGIERLDELDSTFIKHFLEYRQHERGNSQTTLHHAAVALKGMFAFLAKRGYLPENPLAELQVKRPYTITAENVPSPLEMEALLQTAQLETQKLQQETYGEKKQMFLSLRNRAILFLLCTTGLRSSELTELTLEQLNYTKGCLLVRGKGNIRYAKKERRIFLEDANTVDALAEYLKHRPDGYGNTLFLTKNGLPMETGDLHSMVTTYAQKAGLKNKYSPHKLRAGFASMMVFQGIDPLTLKELMGHDSLQTTLKCYTNLEEKQLHQVWKECNPLSRLRRKEWPDDL